MALDVYLFILNTALSPILSLSSTRRSIRLPTEDLDYSMVRYESTTLPAPSDFQEVSGQLYDLQCGYSDFLNAAIAQHVDISLRNIHWLPKSISVIYSAPHMSARATLLLTYLRPFVLSLEKAVSHFSYSQIYPTLPTQEGAASKISLGTSLR